MLAIGSVDYKITASIYIHYVNSCEVVIKEVKLSVLPDYMPNDRTRFILKSFNYSHFGWYPLQWMCYDRRTNQKINTFIEDL